MNRGQLRQVTGQSKIGWMTRIAILSDIHGDLTAFEAVLTDLRETSPDQVLHGGDLVSGGSSSSEVVDRVHDLGWIGVFGNSEEAIARPKTLEEFAKQSPAPQSLWDAVREMTTFTGEALGEERIAWLDALPRVVIHPPVALVHDTCWPLLSSQDGNPERLQIRQFASGGPIVKIRRVGPLTLYHVGPFLFFSIQTSCFSGSHLIEICPNVVFGILGLE